jgi:hypothetical protein
MGYAELIECLQSLPQEKQAEVFDFVEFLASRAHLPPGNTQQDWSDHDFSDMAMAQALRGLEDESVAYTVADLQERWA